MMRVLELLRRIIPGTAVVAVALIPGVWGSWDTARPAAAQVDPCQVAEQKMDTVNSGDVDAVMEFYTDDVVVEGTPMCTPCVGKEVVRPETEYAVAYKWQTTVVSCEVSGNTATYTLDMRGPSTEMTGIDRLTALGSHEVRDGKISYVRFDFDLSDATTADWMARWVGVSVELGPGRDADQSPGTATLLGLAEATDVLIDMSPGPTGVRQPANIHEGTCASLGPVAFSLHDVIAGKSGTPLLSIPIGDLQTSNYAIAIQESQDEPDLFVACGDIPAAAPEVPAAGSGGLLAEGGGGVAAWWYALAAGGALLVAAGLAVLARMQSRR